MGIFYTVLYVGLALGPVLAGFVSAITNDVAAPVYLIAVFALFMVLARLDCSELCRRVASRQPYRLHEA